MFGSGFARTAYGTRVVHDTIAIVFATCMTCLTFNDSNAASTSGREFGIAHFDPFESTSIADATSTSFASRFEYAEASLRPGVVDHLIYRVPVLPIEKVTVTRQQDIVPAGPAIIGTASMYNPDEPGDADSGNSETASGEHYDARDWTAAIRTDLRAQFGGVRYGKNYVPTYALVQTIARQAIVRINDVGPLKPGRVIDLNEQAMRYFDPSLQRGLIDGVKITPLAGQQWALGPVLDDGPVSVASFDK
jgi:rare lipoprotein A